MSQTNYSIKNYHDVDAIYKQLKSIGSAGNLSIT